MIPASVIHRLLSRSRHSASNAFYNHGKRCATHQVLVMILCLVSIVTLSYPLLLDYSQGLDYSSAADNRHDASLFWEHPLTRIPISEGAFVDDCQERPVIRIEQVILNASLAVVWATDASSTNRWRSNAGALDREVLFHGLRLQEKISKATVDVPFIWSLTNFPKSAFSGPKASLADICLIPESKMSQAPTSSSCLIQSPLDFWDNNFERLLSDPHIAKTISNNNHTSSRHDILIPPSSVLQDVVRDRRSHRIRSASALVLTYFIREHNTCLKAGSKDAWNMIMSQVSNDDDSLSDTSGWPSFQIIQESGEAKNVLFNFNEEGAQPARAEVFLLALGYLVVFLYISLSIGRMHLVKSKFGLGFAALAQVFFSLILSLSLCSLFNVRMTLVPGEILPFLIIVLGVENMTLLTNAVVETNADLPVRERIARGLSNVGLPITLSVIGDLGLLLTVGVLGVAAVREFCAFASLALVIDYALQMSYFITILSIDLRRLELGDLGSRPRQSSAFAMAATGDSSNQNISVTYRARKWLMIYVAPHFKPILESKVMRLIMMRVQVVRRPRASSFFIIICILASLSIFYSSPVTFGNTAKTDSTHGAVQSPEKTSLVQGLAGAADSQPTSTATLYHASPLSLNGSFQAKAPPFLRHLTLSEKIGRNDIGGGALIAAAIHHVGGWWHHLLHGPSEGFGSHEKDDDVVARAAESFWNLINPRREPIFMSVRPPWHAQLIESDLGQPLSSTESALYEPTTVTSQLGEEDVSYESPFQYSSLFKLLVGPMLTLTGALLWLLSSLLGGTLASVDDESEVSVNWKQKSSLFLTKAFRIQHEKDVEWLIGSSKGYLLSVGLDRKVLIWDTNSITSSPIIDLTNRDRHEQQWPMTAIALDSGAKHVAYRINASKLCLRNSTAMADDSQQIFQLYEGSDTILGFWFLEDACLPASSVVPPSPGLPPSPCFTRRSLSDTNSTTVLAGFASGKFLEYDCRSGEIVSALNVLHAKESGSRLKKAWMFGTSHVQTYHQQILAADDANRLICWKRTELHSPWLLSFDISLCDRIITSLYVTSAESLADPDLLVAGFSDGSILLLRYDTGRVLFASDVSTISPKRLEVFRADSSVNNDSSADVCKCKTTSLHIFASSNDPGHGLRHVHLSMTAHKTNDTDNTRADGPCMLHDTNRSKSAEASLPQTDQTSLGIPLASHGIYQRRQSQQDRKLASTVGVVPGDGLPNSMGQQTSLASQSILLNREEDSKLTIRCFRDHTIDVEAGDGWGRLRNCIVGIGGSGGRASIPNDRIRSEWRGWYIDTSEPSLEVTYFEMDLNGESGGMVGELRSQASTMGRSASLARRQSGSHSGESNPLLKMTASPNSEPNMGAEIRLPSPGLPSMSASFLPVTRIHTCTKLSDNALAFAIGNEIWTVTHIGSRATNAFVTQASNNQISSTSRMGNSSRHSRASSLTERSDWPSISPSSLQIPAKKTA